jgi:hypothetical protein
VPATLTVAVRALPALATTLTVAVPGPEPDPATDVHELPDDDVHEQPAAVVTATVALPAELPKLRATGDTE